MKYTLIIITLLALGGLALWYGLFMSPVAEPKETDTPQDTTMEQPSEEQGGDDSNNDLIKLESPQPNETISNPVVVSGEARGQWFFEANAPVVVVDWDGRIIGEGYITAEGEWMTEDFVPFSGSIAYDLPADSYSSDGAIIFQRANPSGLPENDAAYEVPVTLTSGGAKGEASSSLPVAATRCTPEQKTADFCTEEYAPVCGVVETRCEAANSCEIERKTFSNSCFACTEENVVAYTTGECVTE